jgi:AraC family transcriptional regulator, regulatory protein of adaptative response / methylated-DNA-[protein]-cysteine methyltransferase
MKPTILVSTGRCALGMVLVAQNERGVCAILLGDDPRRLERDLAACFPEASLQQADNGLLEKVVSFIERPGDALDLALDLQGSEFEQRVWRALQDVPAGSTVAYGEIAARIGAPGAAKDVGEACAANRLAVAIPCHRVVRKDGGLAGYRWGVQRKRALLELERGRP